jgi:L-methionine (R)-S-oxide reductase
VLEQAEKSAAASWLAEFVQQSGGVAGSVHRVTGDLLALAAAVNLPEPVQRVTASIPKGKGMAGLAWQRGVPVQTCNLQTDASGDVQPGARAVAARAAIAIPVYGPGGDCAGVVGVAFADDRELDADAVARLSHGAAGWLRCEADAKP